MSEKSMPPTQLKHPYYPWDLKLPHYVPNKMDAPKLLAIAGIAALLTFVVAWVISGRRQEQFSVMRRLTLCWFMVCALIHTVLEGYFAVYHKTLAGHSTYLGEMCEYINLNL